MKWSLLVTAPDQLTAEMWRDLLIERRIPAMVKPGDISSFMGVSPLPCRLMVASDRVEEARSLLEDYLGREL